MLWNSSKQRTAVRPHYQVLVKHGINSITQRGGGFRRNIYVSFGCHHFVFFVFFDLVSSYISHGECKITKRSYKVAYILIQCSFSSILVMSMIGSICVVTRNNEYEFGYNRPIRVRLTFLKIRKAFKISCCSQLNEFEDEQKKRDKIKIKNEVKQKVKYYLGILGFVFP